MAPAARPEVAGLDMDDAGGASAGERLEHDHHRIDEGFARFAASLGGSDVDRDAYDDAATALRHHIYIEEVHHFPVVRAAGLMGPILVMLREHGEIWDLLDGIAAALDASRVDEARSLWPQLADVLEQHNMKEERIVYPAGDEALPPEVAAAITDELASGRTPAGWACEMAER